MDDRGGRSKSSNRGKGGNRSKQGSTKGNKDNDKVKRNHSQGGETDPWKEQDKWEVIPRKVRGDSKKNKNQKGKIGEKLKKNVGVEEVGKKGSKVDGGIKSGTYRFKYEHNPSDNLKVLQDTVENSHAVYGYPPNPNSESIGGYATKIDWTNPLEVAKANARREAYHVNNDNISELVIKMKLEGYSTEQIASSANKQRNLNRLNDYINDSEGLALVKKRNMSKYGNESGPTAEYLYNKYGSWDKVIEKSMSANPGMDACCGLYDKYFQLYNLN